MRKFILLIVTPIIIYSCKPSFNLLEETKNIQDFTNGNLDFESQMNLFPDSYRDKIAEKDVLKLSDSLEKIVDSLFFKETDVVSDKYDITKISSTRKIKKNYFKIIQLNSILTLKKNKENIYLHNYKSYLNNNLIEYKEHDFKLTEPITVYLEKYILAFWKPSYKKWNYMYYNDSANQFLFGSKTAKEIIQLYFDEIFVPAKVPWSKKDLNDFYEIYNEYKYDDTYEGLDFDKFCKCKIKFEEKIEKVEEIPSQYYESESYFEIIQKCMIYSKIN